MKDNLFDTRITFMDVVKLFLITVTMFSTWNIIKIITPPGAFSFVREIAAVGMVEGAFLGFEFATAKAKNKQQMKYSTIGFFASLAVIAIYAGVSGLLEFAGPALLATQTGVWAGINWTVRDVVGVFAITVLVLWIGALASIYRLYSLEDPDKAAEIARITLDGEVADESNNAMRYALQKAKPVIAQHRALANLQEKYGDLLGVDGINALLHDVKGHLTATYNGSPTLVEGTPFESRNFPVETQALPTLVKTQPNEWNPNGIDLSRYFGLDPAWEGYISDWQTYEPNTIWRRDPAARGVPGRVNVEVPRMSPEYLAVWEAVMQRKFPFEKIRPELKKQFERYAVGTSQEAGVGQK